LVVPAYGAPAVTWPSIPLPVVARKVPATWTHTEGTPTGGNLLESFWEALVNEEIYLKVPLSMIGAQTTLNVDPAEPAFAWTIEYTYDAEKVEVQLDNDTWLALDKATDALDLFNSGKRLWMQDGRTLLISGLDIVQTATEVVDGWHFIDPGLISAENMFWIQHPDSKNWIQIHPSRIREDGFLGFTSSSSIQIRVRISSNAPFFTAVNARINGERVVEARCVNLRTSLDDASIWCRLDRFDLETNADFLERLRASQWFCRTQNKTSCRNYLSIALGTAQYNTLPSSSTVVSLASGFTGFSLKGMEQTVYAVESGLIPNQELAGTYRTLLADPEMGIGFLRGHDVQIDESGGVVTPDTDVYNNALENLVARWKLQIWTETASSLVFTANYRPIEELTLLTAMSVDVVDPSEDTLKKAFERSSPTRIWQRYDIGETKVKGLARFD
jgi:hypothetical protein